VENLKAVFIDVTFPNAMQNIADLSKHLTPQKLKEELKKLKSSAAVYAYHIKAQHEKEIVKEMAKCCPAVRAVNEGEVMIISG
jgi:cAMP phosphodiesterase